LIGRLNIDKISVVPKVIYRFNATPIKIPTAFFFRNRIIHLEIHIECQGTPNSQTVLKKKNKVRGFTFLDFKTYCKATVIRTDTKCDTGLKTDLETNGIE